MKAEDLYSCVSYHKSYTLSLHHEIITHAVNKPFCAPL